MKKTLSSRLSESVFITMLIVTGLFLAVGIPIQLQQSESSRDMVCFVLDTLVSRDHDSLANELFERRFSAVELRLMEISRVDNIKRVTLYDKDGMRLTNEPGNVDSPASISVKNRQAEGERYHAFEDGDVLVFTRPVRALGEPIGWIEIVYDMTRVHQQALFFYTFFGTLLLLTLACMYVFLRHRMQRFVIHPLQRLMDVMESVRVGKMLPRPDMTNETEEIGNLMDTFWNMSERLHRSYADLDEKNVQLMQLLEEAASNAEALGESEARFRAIVDQAPVGIMLFDNDGVVISTNQFFADMMGAPDIEAIIGLNMLKDTPVEAVQRCVRQAIEAGESRYEDYYTSVSGGKLLYIRARLKRFTEKLLCGVFEDLSEQKVMLDALAQSEASLAELNRGLEETVEVRTRDLALKAAELEKANERLRELDTLKTSFLSAVSHELRTPLTSILGFAKVTEKSFSKNFMALDACEDELREKREVIERNLRIIGSEGGRLSRLVNDLLDLARIESGRMSWDDSILDPAEVIVQAAEASSVDFEESGVSLEVNLPDEPLPVWMDADKLMQVVRNLLHNAVKFTGEGSVSITLEAFPEESQVELRVEDTGAGIPESELEAVFERFHQVEQAESDKGKPQGSGLGLAISRQIIEHYDGRIWVESEEGRGAVFRIRLPLVGKSGHPRP